jgi:hypothetical protein
VNWWLHLAVLLTICVNFAFAETRDSVPRTFERSTLPNGTGVRWGQASNPGPRHSFDDPEGTPMDQEEDPQGWSPTDHSGTVHDEPPDETMLLPSNSSPAPAATVIAAAKHNCKVAHRSSTSANQIKPSRKNAQT